MFRLAPLFVFSWTTMCNGVYAEDVVVKIHLQVYADVPPEILQRAQCAAADIFRKAGIELRWGDNGQPDDSKLPGIYVVILPDKMARTIHASSDQFGLAVFGGRAYIFLDRLTSFAKDEMVRVSQLLGPVMAHEIGHLLLGPKSHFTVGIMHGRWRKAEVKHALMGSLVFTSEQARIMRSDVRRRTQNENLID